MTIHKEGYTSIAIAGLIYVLISYLAFSFISFNHPVIAWALFILVTGFFLFIISFFRVPNRVHTQNAKSVIAPADGKVVVIEETVDAEYFKDKRLQVSIFMSPLNVHVNRNPIDGEVLYSQYHKGKYLVAWDPKSSTENERHSVVIKNMVGYHTRKTNCRCRCKTDCKLSQTRSDSCPERRNGVH